MSLTAEEAAGPSRLSEQLPDADLVHAAAEGHQAAFAELYRRYADKARRVARKVAGNADDGDDAFADAFANVFRVVRAGRFPTGVSFEAYLLTAVRRSALDELRRASRTVLRAEMDTDGSLCGLPRPSERLMAVASAAIVARAFLGLGSGFRAVLYLTEVEGLPLREAADRLGMSPNACAQRAVRARSRLRQLYLQAHVAGAAALGCQDTVSGLGAYLARSLSRPAGTKVEAHLAGCEACRYRLVELHEIGGTLRKGLSQRIANSRGSLTDLDKSGTLPYLDRAGDDTHGEGADPWASAGTGTGGGPG